MPDYIYKAQIKNGGERISYRNSNGQTISYNPGEKGYASGGNYHKKTDAVILFNAVNKYFTGDSPNITPEEQVKMRADIAKQRPPISGMRERPCYSEECLNIYEGVDFVLKTFSDDASEGGKNITPNEIYQMYEIFHKWTE